MRKKKKPQAFITVIGDPSKPPAVYGPIPIRYSVRKKSALELNAQRVRRRAKAA